MLRAAHYWDFLDPFHYLVILCFLCVLAFQIRLLRRARGKIIVSLQVVLIFVSLFVGLVLRQTIFPGGGLHDPSYETMKVGMHGLRDQLSEYFDECGHYPTTEQGLGLLYNKTSDDRCKDETAERSRYSDIRYISNGKSYEMESLRKYSITGLVVRATNDEEARLYS